MHSYASDSPDRCVARWIIAICAVGIAFIYGLISRLYQIVLPWWSETPTIMLVYGLIFWIYDSWLWRQKILGLHFSSIPDCNGTWYGTLHSLHDQGTTIEGMLLVCQTWTKIILEFRTDSSTSYSRMASFNVTPGASQGLMYEYTNDPRADSRATMHAHRGLAFLKLTIDGNYLEGDYYTGRDRSNYGTLQLRLISRKKLDIQEAKVKFTKLEAKPA